MATALGSGAGNAASRITDLGNIFDTHLANRRRLGFDLNNWNDNKRMNFVNQFNTDGGRDAAAQRIRGHFNTAAYDQVGDVYQSALGRRADEAGRNYWLGQLASNQNYDTNWQDELARQFRGSAEGIGRSAVDDAYNAYISGAASNQTPIFTLQDDGAKEWFRDRFVGPGQESGVTNWLDYTDASGNVFGGETGAADYLASIGYNTPITGGGGTNDTITGGGGTDEGPSVEDISNWSSWLGSNYNRLLGLSLIHI